MKERLKAEQEAEARRHDLEQKEDAAIAELDSSSAGMTFKKICNALTGVKLFDTDGPEKKAAALKECRREALEKEQAIRHQRQEALSMMTEFAVKVQNCQTGENMAAIAVDALHQAIGALKELSAVMMQAAVFWKQMQDHCRTLAESDMKKQVEKAMEFSEEKRLKVWTSKGFKIKAVRFYAGWVTLNGVCKIYIESIKATQKDLSLHHNLEESRQNVKELAQNFLSDLHHHQQAIAEKEFEAQEKIKALDSDEAQ